MNAELWQELLSVPKETKPQLSITDLESPLPIKVATRGISYTARHRGTWFKPEYNFEEIQIAQDTDSYFFRSVQKKVNKVIVAGIDFVGSNPEAVDYIKTRLNELGYSTGKPFEHLIWDTFHDLFRFSNCIWVKARNEEASSGESFTTPSGQELVPVAGYFILPFETLEFKTKVNGELKKVLERCDGREKEYSPRDIIHFYANRKPGFLAGTPEVLPALDDLALLRRIEENVEDLIETNLFPVYHYQIGTEAHPERFGPDGVSESDVLRKRLEYMPAAGVYISDHRHEISVVGSEGKALQIEVYLNYFKTRALAGLGTSSLDMGEGDSTNKSTAGTLTKGMLMDIEAMTRLVRTFLEFHVISELLVEGGFNPLESEEMVQVKFGVIDKDERRADENQQIQLYHGNLRTVDEVRKSLGDEPWTDPHTERSHYKIFEEPAALLKGMGPGTAASEILGKHSSSNVTPEAVTKEKTFAQQQMNKQSAAKKASARPGGKSKSGSARKSSAAKARPSNQHGQRSSPKTNRDIFLEADGIEVTFTCDFEPEPAKVAEWQSIVYNQYNLFKGSIALETIAETTSWRLRSEE